MKSAAPTRIIDERLKELHSAKGDTWRDESWRKGEIELLQQIKMALEAPSAAERTALENIRKKIEQDFDFWVGFGYSDHSILRDDILKMKATILKEFDDAASASEGTNTP